MAFISEDYPLFSSAIRQYYGITNNWPIYATTNRLYIKKIGSFKESKILDGSDLKPFLKDIGITSQISSESIVTLVKRVEREIERGNTVNPKWQIPDKILRLSIYINQLLDYDSMGIANSINDQAKLLGVDEACLLFISLMDKKDQDLLYNKWNKYLTNMQLTL